MSKTTKTTKTEKINKATVATTPNQAVQVTSIPPVAIPDDVMKTLAELVPVVHAGNTSEGNKGGLEELVEIFSIHGPHLAYRMGQFFPLVLEQRRINKQPLGVARAKWFLSLIGHTACQFQTVKGLRHMQKSQPLTQDPRQARLFLRCMGLYDASQGEEKFILVSRAFQKLFGIEEYNPSVNVQETPEHMIEFFKTLAAIGQKAQFPVMDAQTYFRLREEGTQKPPFGEEDAVMFVTNIDAWRAERAARNAAKAADKAQAAVVPTPTPEPVTEPVAEVAVTQEAVAEATAPVETQEQPA